MQNFISCISRHLHACMHLSHSFRASSNLTFPHSFRPPLTLSCADDEKISSLFSSFLSTPQSAHNPCHLVCECGGKIQFEKLMCVREKMRHFSLYDDEKPSPEPKRKRRRRKVWVKCEVVGWGGGDESEWKCRVEPQMIIKHTKN